jgi:hypothetical protein
MIVVLEGQARVVYEDTLTRKGEVCPYSRRSIRTDIPKEFKFGLHSFASSNSLSPKSPKNDSESEGKLLTASNTQGGSPRSNITY